MLNETQEKMMNEEEWEELTLVVLGLRMTDYYTVRRLATGQTNRHFRDKMKETTIGLVCVGVEYIKEYLVPEDQQGNPVDKATVAEYPTTNMPSAVIKLFEHEVVKLNKSEKKDVIGYVNRIIDYRENKIVRPTHQQRMAEMGIEGTVVVYPEPMYDIYGQRTDAFYTAQRGDTLHTQQEEEE